MKLTLGLALTSNVAVFVTRTFVAGGHSWLRVN